MSIPLLVLMLIGLLMFAFAQSKLSEVGRIIFFCALLAICFGHMPGELALRIR
jgi:Na+/phosphate symporter